VSCRLDRAVRDAIVAAARSASPGECCGILIGTRQHISAVHLATNLETAPHRYLIDPRDHFAARRQARRAGLDVVGFFHSHPHAPAVPSSTDLQEATYPDHLYLIVGLPSGVQGEPDLRLYVFTGQTFQPEALGGQGDPAQ
jgi:proteasome lid subunit RPN8/RPN11